MILRQPECALHDLTVVRCMCPSSSHLCGCPSRASVCALHHLTYVSVLFVPFIIALACVLHAHLSTCSVLHVSTYVPRIHVRLHSTNSWAAATFMSGLRGGSVGTEGLVTNTFMSGCIHVPRILVQLSTNAQRIHVWLSTLVERNPPPWGGFPFTMFPHQEPCVRGPPSKDVYQVLRGGSSYTQFLMREHSK